MKWTILILGSFMIGFILTSVFIPSIGIIPTLIMCCAVGFLWGTLVECLMPKKTRKRIRESGD